MKQPLTPADRLIVAADFKHVPQHNLDYTKRQLMNLVSQLAGTGVYIKVNSLIRVFGYGMIDEMHQQGVRVFADLKLCDIGNTLANDGSFLRSLKPDLLTAMCVSGEAALSRLKDELPDTDVLGVTTLTSIDEAEAQEIYGCPVNESVLRLAGVASRAGIDGLISSPAEVPLLHGRLGGVLSLNTPGIRPEWAMVEGDDQNLDRVMTPTKAIVAGVDRLVIGRPITQASNPREAVQRTLEEIEQALVKVA